MRTGFVYGAVGALVGVVTLSSVAAAAEQGVIRARLELDRVEGRIRGLKTLDERGAKKFLDQVGRANAFLKECKKHDDPDWLEQAKRSQRVEAQLRALAGGAPAPAPEQPQPAASGETADAYTRQAKNLLDEVARGLGGMPAGDVPTANRLVKLVNQAVDQLKRSTRRATPLWKECAKRSRELDAKIRARAAEPAAGAKPAPPAKKGRPAPGEGAARAFAPLRQPSVSFEHRTDDRVDTIRWGLAEALVPQIERLVEEGKVPQAKQLLWGVWAQLKAKTPVRKAEYEAACALYQRARDSIYGSQPVMRTDDGLVEVDTQLQFARSALKAGNPTTATRVRSHLETLVREGLELPPETQKVLEEMGAEQAAAWNAANAAMKTAALAMFQAGAARDNVCLGDRVFKVYNELHWFKGMSGRGLTSSSQNLGLLKRYEPLLLGVLMDFDACRAALPAFAAAPFDPEFVDIYCASALKQNRAFSTNVRFLIGAIRGAVFGTETLEALGLPREIWKIYHGVVENSFAEVEKAYQRDNTAQAKAELQAAVAWIEHAKVNRLPEDEVQRLLARVKELEGSAGVGKLRRADQILTKVETALEGATAEGSFDYAQEQLTAARGWLERSKEGGVDAKELARVEKRYADLRGPVWTRSLLREAEKPLSRAEAFLVEARGHVGKAESAFDAVNPLWHAEKRLEMPAPFLARVTDASARQTLDARIAKVKAGVLAVRAQVEENQRLPKDHYTGGGSWRERFKGLVQQERGWKVLALSICDEDWKEKTATYDYAGGGNTRVHETRWYKHLHAWAAIQNAEDPERVDLRYLGFRLHKMTDGSYRMLKVYRVGDPSPMLKKNLP